jgi:hypothetical protein
MFCFERTVSLAIFVALSSVAILAQSNVPPSSKQQKRDHKLKIVNKYHQASDTTVVQFFLKQPNSLARLAGGGTSAGPTFGEDVGISASFSHPGKQVLQPVNEALIWVAYTGGPRTALTSEVRAIIDGRDLVLSRQVEAPVSPDRRNGTRLSSFSFSVSRDQLAQLANGSEVVLALPSGERITVTRQQRNALADFTRRMSP